MFKNPLTLSLFPKGGGNIFGSSFFFLFDVRCWTFIHLIFWLLTSLFFQYSSVVRFFTMFYREYSWLIDVNQAKIVKTLTKYKKITPCQVNITSKRQVGFPWQPWEPRFCRSFGSAAHKTWSCSDDCQTRVACYWTLHGSNIKNFFCSTKERYKRYLILKLKMPIK